MLHFVYLATCLIIIMLFEMMEEIRFLKWDLGIGKTKNDGKSCAFL